jgi:hypothetical protein
MGLGSRAVPGPRINDRATDGRADDMAALRPFRLPGRNRRLSGSVHSRSSQVVPMVLPL